MPQRRLTTTSSSAAPPFHGPSTVGTTYPSCCPEGVPSCARRIPSSRPSPPRERGPVNHVSVAPAGAPAPASIALKPSTQPTIAVTAQDDDDSSFVSSSRAATVGTEELDSLSWGRPPFSSPIVDDAFAAASPPPAPNSDPTRSFSGILTAAVWRSSGGDCAAARDSIGGASSVTGSSRFADADTEREVMTPQPQADVGSPPTSADSHAMPSSSVPSAHDDIFIPPAFPDEMRHQPCYCEENAYWMADHVVGQLGKDLDRCEVDVVFISNHNRTVTMWQQRASSRSTGHIVWDYHVVVLLRRFSRTGRPTGAWIYDADTRMSGKSLKPKHLRPVPLAAYLDGSFRFAIDVGAGGPVTQEAHTSPSRRPLFRLVDAQAYLDGFASDRSHMLFDGCWLAPPPPWPPIEGRMARLRRQTNILEEFVDMGKTAWGRILELGEMDAVVDEGCERAWGASTGEATGEPSSAPSQDLATTPAAIGTPTTGLLTAARRAEALEAALGLSSAGVPVSPSQEEAGINSPPASGQTIEFVPPSQRSTPALLAAPVRPSPRKRPAPLPPSVESTYDTTDRFKDASSSEPTPGSDQRSFLEASNSDSETETEADGESRAPSSSDRTRSSEARDQLGELPSDYLTPTRERRARLQQRVNGENLLLAYRLAPPSRPPPPAPPAESIPFVFSPPSSSSARSDSISHDADSPLRHSGLRPAAPANVPVSPSSSGTPSPLRLPQGTNAPPIPPRPGYLLTPPGSSHGGPEPSSPVTPRRGGRVTSPLFPAYLASSLASRATRARGSYMGLADGSIGPANGSGPSISKDDLERLKQLA